VHAGLWAVLGVFVLSVAGQAAHDKTRANAYDDAWQSGPNGWVANAKAILAGGTNKTPGFTLLLGDSLTHGIGLTAWAQNGAGKTAEDAMITQWLRASPATADVNSKDGFGLSNPYICASRSFTVGDGLGAWDVLGSGMPRDDNLTTARQKLLDCGSYPNALNIYTILAAFPDAQFAVPEYNLDANTQGFGISDFTRLVDLLISRHVVPIIITYTYRDLIPAGHPFNQWVDNYNGALVQLAQTKKLPLIDLNAEMLARRPFSNWLHHFLSSDGVHYTNGSVAYPPGSDPYQDGGDPATHTTGNALMENGYGLKGWLIVQKMKEIKQLVIDSAPPLPPQPPTGLEITGMAGSTVAFAWTPPVLGPQPTGFQIEGGMGPADVLGTIPLGPIPTVSLTLPPGTFHLRVRTLAGGVASGPSNEVVARVRVPAAPSPPERLLGLVDGDRLRLTWRNTFDGGVPTNAILDVTGTHIASVPLGFTDTLSFAGVPPGQHTLAVRTTNASGASAPSNALSLAFPGPCTGPPFTPVGFVAVSAGHRVYLRWDAAAAGPAPAAYVIQVTGSLAATVRATGRVVDATAPAGTYAISVSAENACGTSAPTTAAAISVSS
jgi:hypothetical protein